MPVVEEPIARTTEPSMRLFVAADVPETVALAVAAAIGPWRAACPDVRWVPPANWHITLKFLGATSMDRVGWVEEIIGGVASMHGHLTPAVRGLGAFPSVARARVLWAGVVDDTGTGLEALSADLETGLAPVVRAEDRRFHPHLTVGRSGRPVSLPIAYGDTPLATEPFTVDRVVLYRSRVRDDATTYEPLGTFPLGRGRAVGD